MALGEPPFEAPETQRRADTQLCIQKYKYQCSKCIFRQKIRALWDITPCGLRR
jgi:hypothetical protein